MIGDEALDYLKEKYNMVETVDRGGYRYLRFAPGTQWVACTGMNKYVISLRDKFEWKWLEHWDKNGILHGYELIWENTIFKNAVCDKECLDSVMDRLYNQWKKLEQEIKEKKYQMKLNRIKSDF